MTFFQTLHISDDGNILFFGMFLILVFWPLSIENLDWMIRIFVVNALIVLSMTYAIIQRRREKKAKKKKDIKEKGG